MTFLLNSILALKQGEDFFTEEMIFHRKNHFFTEEMNFSQRKRFFTEEIIFHRGNEAQTGEEESMEEENQLLHRKTVNLTKMMIINMMIRTMLKYT